MAAEGSTAMTLIAWYQRQNALAHQPVPAPRSSSRNPGVRSRWRATASRQPARPSSSTWRLAANAAASRSSYAMRAMDETSSLAAAVDNEVRQQVVGPHVDGDATVVGEAAQRQRAERDPAVRIAR